MIYNYILDYIYSRFNHLLSYWNQRNSWDKSPSTKLLWVFWWNSFTKLSSKDKTLFIRVTSEYTVSIFKVRLYLTDSLIILLARMWDNSMIITMLHESGFLTDLQRSAWHNNQPLRVDVSPVYPLSNSSSSSIFRDGSKTAATSKMERFVITV